MKKITKLVIGVIVFVSLLYQQSPGVNIAIICLVMWFLIFLNRSKKQSVKTFWLLSACLFITAIAFAWYGDVFSFFALLISTLIFGIWSQYPTINILLYPVLWVINYLSFIFRVFYFKYWLPVGKTVSDFWKKTFAFVLIPGVFVIFFIFVYASGSDLFASLFKNITFHFEFFEVTALLLLGFFLLFNFWFMLIPKQIIRWNHIFIDDFHAGNQHQLKPVFSFLPLDFERKSGEISLILLNALLLFFIVTYNYEQFFRNGPDATLSSEIHNRVAMIIFSIVMAIAVIMFYFKSTFNFDDKARNLKLLTIGWIILNSLLIISAFIKNTEYVLTFGLTYKRIGVFIFLTLSLAGLFITFLKLKFKKTNFFLLNRMAWVFFGTFIVTSCINFSWIVTKYNITWHKNEDIHYLRSLDYNKQILFDRYHNDPLWQEWLGDQKDYLNYQINKPILSAAFYYKFLNLDDKSE